MERSEYARIKLSNFPQKFIDEYELTKHTCDGWIYFENLRGCHGLPHVGKLSNDLLRIHINKSAYYEAAITPGLWRHKWRPFFSDSY